MKQEGPKFKSVLDRVDLDGNAAMASSVRQAHQAQDNMITPGLTTRDVSSPVQCNVVIPPYHGSYNLEFKVLFQDGVEWLLKVPANGYSDAFDFLAANALESEAETMRLIKRKPSIPVPEVHSYDASMNNAVHCPFILLDLMRGKSLHRAWFDDEASAYRLELIRMRALQTVAASMTQLS